MELRTRSRRRRLFVARTLGTIGLSLVLTIVYFNFRWDTAARPTRPVRTSSGQIVYQYVAPEPIGPDGRQSIRQLAQLGAQMFCTYAICQFFLLLVITPVYCAGCIAGDRERRVLEMVFLSRLSNIELITGKFLVRLMELGMLGLTGLPSLFLCLLLGGVSWSGLLTVGLLTLVMIAFAAAVALLVSIVAARVLSAVVLTYMVLLIVWAGLPTVVIMRYIGSPVPTTGSTFLAIALNPAMGIATASLPQFGAAGVGNPWFESYKYCIGVYGVGTIGLLLLSLLVVRRLGLWASRERVPRGTRRELKKVARRVWDNPVAWREVKTIAVHRRMRWARIFALILLVLVSTPVWVLYLADLIERGQPMTHDIHQYTMVIACTAVIAWLLMVLQGSMSYAFERDRSTLDALLTTPLSGRQIVLGKLAGIVRSSAFALGAPLFFIALAVSHGVTSWRGALLGVVIVFVGAMLAASWGLCCSISTTTSVKAATYAFLAALLLYIGVPMLLGSELILSHRFRRELIPATLVSPTLNLDYAVFENPDHTSPERYSGHWLFKDWDERVFLAYMYVSLTAALSVAFALVSMQRIDRWHRVGPRAAPPPASLVSPGSST
jgi:ABC-type transport system involved in multi-copper enzyme maturation permease subunit